MSDFGTEGRIQPGRESGRAAIRAVAWRFQILAEIANFAALRRQLGCGRASRLANDVAARIGTIGMPMYVSVAGRTLVAIEFAGERIDLLDEVTRTIRRVCDAPFEHDDETWSIELVCAGAFVATFEADDVRLAEEAEAALDEARSAGRAGTDIVVPVSSSTRRLAGDLEQAVARNELLIEYQPKIHVRRQEIGSAEALVRWHHPERGLIPPGDFIPAAERFQFVGGLTLWTLRRVIADQRMLVACGHDLRLFINISGQLLGDAGFVEDVCGLVAGTDAKLGFEVTETSVIRDPASAIANIQRFADIGVTIAIDDYGAGLSSLAYLKQLPARELKIDKQFVTQLTTSNRDPLIVRSTIDLAHAMEMEVVAEGVETHAALALLTVMGCDMVQGFLISEPIARDALIAFLDADHHHFAPRDNRASFAGLAAAWKRA